MARRDNQGIQIAMIVFILTTLLFMVGTYLGYSNWASASSELEQAKKQKQDSDNQVRTASSAADAMKVAIGLDQALGDDAAETEAKRYVNDVMGAGLPEESRNFLAIVRARDASIADLRRQLTSANAEVRNLTEALKTAKKTNEQALAKAQADVEQATAQYNKQRTDFDKARTATETRLAKITSDAQSNVAAANKKASEAAKLADVAKGREAELQGRAQNLQGKLNEIDRDTPDQYDGKILGVVAATKTVLIDIGRADGARAKTAFGVYDLEDTNVRTAKKKALVEITKVISDTRSEARITEIDYRNPIVSGDNIYSPIWSRGTRLGIALVGELDVNKDGRDDRAYLKNLITRNGGQIDADVYGDKSSGGVTVDTRYIVEGKAGLFKPGEGDAKNWSNAEKALRADAERLTVEKMSLSELLELMGSTGSAHSIKYGGGNPNPADFAPIAKDGIQRVSPGIPTSFRERQPTTRRFRVK